MQNYVAANMANTRACRDVGTCMQTTRPTHVCVISVHRLVVSTLFGHKLISEVVRPYIHINHVEFSNVELFG